MRKLHLTLAILLIFSTAGISQSPTTETPRWPGGKLSVGPSAQLVQPTFAAGTLDVYLIGNKPIPISYDDFALPILSMGAEVNFGFQQDFSERNWKFFDEFQFYFGVMFEQEFGLPITGFGEFRVKRTFHSWRADTEIAAYKLQNFVIRARGKFFYSETTESEPDWVRSVALELSNTAELGALRFTFPTVTVGTTDAEFFGAGVPAQYWVAAGGGLRVQGRHLGASLGASWSRAFTQVALNVTYRF